MRGIKTSRVCASVYETLECGGAETSPVFVIWFRLISNSHKFQQLLIPLHHWISCPGHFQASKKIWKTQPSRQKDVTLHPLSSGPNRFMIQSGKLSMNALSPGGATVLSVRHLLHGGSQQLLWLHMSHVHTCLRWPGFVFAQPLLCNTNLLYSAARQPSSNGSL